MYKRECERADRGVARMVPKLREVHIIRDSWTSKDNASKKSNLLWHYDLILSKLQQKDVLTELHTSVTTIPQPLGASEAEYTLKFLEACNLMFENGFLSHDMVSGSNTLVLANIEKGYEFLYKWLDEIYKKVRV